MNYLHMLPVVMSMLITCAVSTNDDGLLRTSNGLPTLIFSSEIYIVLSNLTVISIKNIYIRKWM